MMPFGTLLSVQLAFVASCANCGEVFYISLVGMGLSPDTLHKKVKEAEIKHICKDLKVSS